MSTPGNATGNAVIPDGFGAPRAAKDGGDPTDPSPKGWYSRGYLPHLDLPGLYQSINFRLHDSVPDHVIQTWKEELRWRSDLPQDALAVASLRQRIVAYEDAGHGACWLRDERIATLVENALLHFDGERYRLIAWCIMPNHVHVLIETVPGHSLDRVLHSWKSFTAQKANELLGRSGPFWAREYYDRYIRNDQHFARTVAYIEQNPVKAGFVTSAEAWKFGSAARRIAESQQGQQDAGDPSRNTT
jgi:REP element-mobilizing transposase RayT